MSLQTSGGYICKVCGMTFNSREELDEHNREKHKTTTL
jgi:hypothetical protein